MVLNKIFKPFLTPFTKEKWQSRNSDTRKKAVLELPVSDQDTLNEIALNDPDKSIRAIAANKLSDMDLLQTIIMKGTNEMVKQAAQNRLFQLLCGIKHPVPDYEQREKIIRGSRNPALLEYVSANADQASLREITIKKISRDPLLGDIALTDENPHVRQLAAKQIAKRSTLERVAKNSRRKDKRVYKIVKEKLDRIIEDEERPKLLAKEVNEICDKLEKLFKRSRLLQEKITFENYVTRWSEIHNFANEEITSRYNAISEKIILGIDELEQKHFKEQETIQILECYLNNLSNAIDELLNAREAETPEQAIIEKEEKIILNIGLEWDALIKSLTLPETIDIYNNKFQAILDLADTKTELNESSNNSLEKIQNLTDQVEAMLKKSGYILEKTILALQSKFIQLVKVTKNDSNEMEQYQQRFDTAIKTLKTQLNVQQQNALSFKKEIEKRTEEIQTKITDGHVSKADKLLHDLLKDIDNNNFFSKNEKHYHYNDLKQYQSQLGELSSWRNWAHDNERENLVQKAENLVQQAQSCTELKSDFNDFLSQIKELRLQWKKMRSHTSEDIWQQFNNACNLVYEQCSPYISEQTVARQTNLKQKQALCDQLEQYIVTMSWPTEKDSAIDTSTDWIQVDKIIKQARKEWSDIGFVDRKDHKNINLRFDKAINIIRDELKKVWHSNYEQLLELIQKVLQLHNTLDEDLSGAINKAKEYQKSWKHIGPVSPYQRNKVWKKFRSACDVVFDKRQKNQDQKNSENIERLREKEAICENLEALNQQPLMQKDLENAFNDIQVLWKDLEPQVKSLSKEVNNRYLLATEAYQNKLTTLIIKEKEQQLEVIKQKANFCTQLESLSETDDEKINQVHTDLLEKWQQVSVLPNEIESQFNHRFENALNSVRINKDNLKHKELSDKHHFCLKYEILMGKDSPDNDQKARMEMQVELLKSNMGQNRIEEPDDNHLSNHELQLKWYLQSNYTQDKTLDERFKNLLS